MKISFSKIFKQPPKNIPSEIQSKLLQHFPGALNVDWEFKGKNYEAIFYLENIEHIAHLSKSGELIEFKKNLWPKELPESIVSQCCEQGEIMNSIVICKGEEWFYEIIVRDKLLKRKLLIFNQKQKLLKSTKV